VAGEIRGSASGSLATLADPALHAESFYEFIFDVVDQTETLGLSGVMIAQTELSSSRITLADVNAGGAVLYDEHFTGPAAADDINPAQLSLNPGRYRLTGHAKVDDDHGQAVYDIFVTTSGTPPTTPIPLPAAVYPGLALLALVLRRCALSSFAVGTIPASTE
jgi:hypothetical protein